MMDDKRRYLKKFGARIEWALARGATLTTDQRAFLEEASWQTRRKKEGKRPKRMTDAQKKMKSDTLKRIRRGLENALFLQEGFSFTQSGFVRGAWFYDKDPTKAIPVETLSDLVRMCIRFRTLGKGYADAILPILKEAYAKDHEEIVVLRRLPGPPVI
ncbi:MAG: hypothetical protein LN413_01075 [Candidatus Thermoplasmatota archaeon]|nr:hypothetical protein [Candidatus Thermoplasmatota archaeon]